MSFVTIEFGHSCHTSRAIVTGEEREKKRVCTSSSLLELCLSIDGSVELHIQSKL